MKKYILSMLFAVSLMLLPSFVQAAEKVVDSRNQEITLEAKPEKIVVLGYSEYDTLRALGLESKIVGAPKSNTPNYIGEIADSITDIGSLKEPNLEEIAKLQPDLIIANGRTAELAEELEKIAPVFVFSVDNAQFWQSFVDQNTAIAKLVGEEDKANELIGEIQTLAKSIMDENAKDQVKTLVLMLNEGNISAFSQNSRFSSVFQVFGFVPVDEEIEDSRHGQEMSFEGILAINPGRILYLDRTAAIGGDNSGNIDFTTNELIVETAAAQNDAMIPLTSDLWYLGGNGLESFKLQAEELAAIFK